MMINGYFTIMSIYGWYKWTRKVKGRDSLPITRTNNKEKIIGIGLFYYNFVVFSIYKIFDYQINVDNYIDIIASGIFFQGIYGQQKNKLDPLDYWGYNSNAFVCLSRTWDVIITIFNFTILAISAYIEWRKILNKSNLQL
jgi:nicotinamide mononucleotide transporter